MSRRRTTVTADADDLAVLQAEARRRGVPLARILGEAVASKADELRAERRPRFALGHGDRDLAAVSVEDEDAPASRRQRR